MTFRKEDLAGSDNTRVSLNADLKLGKLGSVLEMYAKGKIKRGLSK